MYEYFEMLENFIGNAEEPKSILKLTLELLKSGGYTRQLYHFKNGKTRVRTFYRKQFDSVLVAQWLCFYKKFFLARLWNHPELKEQEVDIINGTLYMFLSCANKDKLICDNTVNLYFNKALNSRIADAMRENKPRYTKEVYKKGKKAPFKLKGALDKQAISLDEYLERHPCSDIEDAKNFMDEDMLVDATLAVKGDRVGEILLDTLVQSRGKFSMRNIDTKFDIPRHLCTESLKKSFVDNYNKIKTVVYSYRKNDGNRLRLINTNNATYSFERGM